MMVESVVKNYSLTCEIQLMLEIMLEAKSMGHSLYQMFVGVIVINFCTFFFVKISHIHRISCFIRSVLWVFCIFCFAILFFFFISERNSEFVNDVTKFLSISRDKQRELLIIYYKFWQWCKMSRVIVTILIII